MKEYLKAGHYSNHNGLSNTAYGVDINEASLFQHLASLSFLRFAGFLPVNAFISIKVKGLTRKGSFSPRGLSYGLYRNLDTLASFYHNVEGEMAVPQSGRRSFRPTANFSRPRDISHDLFSNIMPLGTLYHKGTAK